MCSLARPGVHLSLPTYAGLAPVRGLAVAHEPVVGGDGQVRAPVVQVFPPAPRMSPSKLEVHEYFQENASAPRTLDGRKSRAAGEDALLSLGHDRSLVPALVHVEPDRRAPRPTRA